MTHRLQPSRESRSPRAPRAGPTALLGLALAALGCSGDEARVERSVAPPPAVEALPARSGRLPGHERASGIVRARNQVAVQSEISARIAAVFVESGETVAAGDPLVELRDDELGERLRQAEAALSMAKAEAAEALANTAEVEAREGRTRRLAAERVASPLDLETQEARLAAVRAQAAQSRARVVQARATVEERRAGLSRALVRAPVAGRVSRRDAEVGLLATPGTVLFVVGDTDEITVKVPLTEEALARVGEGSDVRIRPRANGGEPIRGRLARISPFLRPETFSTVGEIEVDNRDGRLWPGMFVTVDVLHADAGELTLVPAAAAWENPLTGRPAAWVVVDAGALEPGRGELSSESHAVERREIVLRGHADGRMAVEGIAPGEWVVTVGQHLLHAADGGGGEAPDGRVEARVRPADWDRVLALQGLQREDLLRRFMEKQRLVAGALGKAIPEDAAVVEELLRTRAPENNPDDEVAIRPAVGAAGR